MATRKPSQAALQTLVKYKPQFDALMQLADEARSQRTSSVHAANTVAAAVRQSLTDARPGLRGIYDDAGKKLGATGALLPDAFAGLSGPAVDAIKAAAISEAATQRTNLTKARTGALGDLTDRLGRSESGRQQAVLAAGDKLGSDLGKLAQQRQSLTGQASDYESSIIGDLAAQARKERFTAEQNALGRTNSQITAGVNPDGSVIPGGKADKPVKGKAGSLPGGVPLANTKAHATARSTIEEALADVKPIVAAARSKGRDLHKVRSALADSLKVGVDDEPIYETVSDGRGGTKQVRKVDPATGLQATRKGLPKVDEQLVSAALDLAFDEDGLISRTTAKKLHAAGLSVQKLGYTIVSDAVANRRKKAAKKPRKAATVGAGLFAPSPLLPGL